MQLRAPVQQVGVSAGRRGRLVAPVRVASPTTSAAGFAVPLDLSKPPKRVKLTAKDGSILAIGIYPQFAYDAMNSGGWGEVTQQGDLLYMKFDAEGMDIPALNWRTASVFKVPIPPPIDIAIQTKRLEGTLNPQTGEVQMQFDAEFNFTVGSLYKAPPLLVRTQLTTGYTKGKFREGTGQPFQGTSGRLAATAEVPKTGDLFVDTFLILPTDALAVLNAELQFE